MGFAPPPHGGFAFIAAPERQRKGPSYDLGAVLAICEMAIFFLSLGGLARMPGAPRIPSMRFGLFLPRRGDAYEGVIILAGGIIGFLCRD